MPWHKDPAAYETDLYHARNDSRDRLYTMLDTTMLGLLCDEKNVGYYTNAMKVVKIIITVITAIGGTLLPHLSQYHMEGDDESCGRS